jgi:Holliday junction resolvase
MSSAAKAKGSGAERDVVAYLKENGFQYADRRLAGATLDKGDVSGIPGVTIEISEWYCTMPGHVWLDLLKRAINGETKH